MDNANRCGRNVFSIYMIVLSAFFVATLLVTALYIGVAMISTDRPKFRFESLSVSNLNISNNQISGDWTLRVGSTNPNRVVKIKYNFVKVRVFSSAGELMASNPTPNHFVQRHKNYTVVLDPKLTSRRVGLSGEVADLMIGDGVIQVDVHIEVELLYTYGVGNLKLDPLLARSYEYWDVASKGIKLRIISPSKSITNATANATVFPAEFIFTNLHCHGVECIKRTRALTNT